MKISVIYGVAQMMLGTVLKGANALYFRRPVEFIFVVLAQVILMSALFGFMDLLIVVKWTTDWQAVSKEYAAAHPGEPARSAPAIISTMINMFINGGKRPDTDNGLDLIQNQTWWMSKLVVLALISVPSMLLVEPFWAVHSHKKSEAVKEEGDRFENADNHEENQYVKMVKPFLARE